MARDVNEAIQRLRDEYSVDEEVIQALEGSSLRKQLSELQEEAKKGREAQERLAVIESLPKRIEALKNVGVDWDSLNKRDRTIVERELKDFDDIEKVSEFVRDWGFDATPPQEPEAKKIVQHAVGTGNQAPPQMDRETAIAQAQTPEELDAVLKQYPIENYVQ